MTAARLVIVLTVGVAACGGGGDTCRPPERDAGTQGITVSTGGEDLVFGGFFSSENNDCPAGGGATVISVTIRGEQVGGTCPFGCSLALCLPRPDLVGSEPIPLGDTSRVRLESVTATDRAGCLLGAGGGSPSGSVAFAGFCTEAGHQFHLSFAGTVPGTRLCPNDGGPEPTPVTLTLGGAAAVMVQ